MRSLIIILFILLYGGNSLQAQSFEEEDFTRYTVKDGLSDNRILGITQDAYGYIWIATLKGLNRFDGNHFLKFYSDSGRHSLPADEVKQLKWTGPHQLAAATRNGLHIINTTTLQQRNLIVPPGPLNRPYIENHVYGTAGDEAGNTFVLTSSGFYHFDKNGLLVFRYDHFKPEDAEKLDAPFGRSDGIITPQSGVLLIATIAGPYIYYVSKKDWHPIGEKDSPLYQQIGSAKQLVHFMHSDNNAFSVIAEQATELAWFDHRDKKKHPIQTALSGLNKLFGWRSKITRLTDSTQIITGLQKGFYGLHYDKKTSAYTILPALYLPGYRCTAMLTDRQGRLWIGTDNGLLQQKKNTGSIEKIAIQRDQRTAGSNTAIRMLTIANDKIFATSSGEGVYVFDRRSGQSVQRIDLSQYGNDANIVFNLLSLRGDSVYAGTYGPLIGINTHNYQHKKVNLPDWDMAHNWVSWQLYGSNGTWYVTANKNNRFYVRKAGEQTFTEADYSGNRLFNILAPMYITEDPGGNIWFAGHGASRYNAGTAQFDALIDTLPKIRTARKEVNAMAFDGRGNIYIATAGNGLAIYDPSQKIIEHITRSKGLPDNTIRAVHLHGNKLWLGTESGLASYDIRSKHIEVFGIADDMPEGAFTAYSFYYDTLHRQLYGGFNNTIVRFNPDSLVKNNAPPAFFIESIDTHGGDIIHHPGNKIELSHNQNSIVVNLAAINFTDAYQQQFAYRFADNDADRDRFGEWHETGSQQSIIISNLTPGLHRLQVKVAINNNSWPSQVREIDLYIRPPFWQNAWFLAVVASLAGLALWLAYKKRINDIRQKARINTQMAELEIKALHAQMNPHFIFNSLNSIKEMILDDEKQNASRYLSKFAQLIRTNLEQSQQTFISVNQCINHLQQYLEMEQLRFADFSYTIDASNNIPDHVQMPPMLVQPLVENAIWHGVRPIQGDKKLAIRFYRSGGMLICEIEDNGVGYLQSLKKKTVNLSAHRSLGIANIQERLAVLNEKYKMNASLSMIDRSDSPGSNESGTIAILKFNL
ncbi:sensor histidine kinase [Paraflavitalea sp. CAU 1676]|uniref:sensor histidine kinase n=1 Tax=Paraflavitalea sp. CAU 1676 TaxID=3032598 RepID=UPI0023DB7F3C|nr:sensor histidine kinase [Paraflavitalea sp. CAU 1676]MDF2187914.1 histidine kinase [Paraflavitalea sp. CAU 1676]